MKKTLSIIACATLAILSTSCAAVNSGRPLAELLLPAGRVALVRDGGVALRGALQPSDPSQAVYVLQYDLDETPSSAARKAIAESGATLLSPVSGGAYLVRATATQALAILDAGIVAAAREYLAEDKIAPGLSGGLENAAPSTGAANSRILVVSFFHDCEPAAVKEAIAAIDGCEVLDGADGMFRVSATSAAIPCVASLPQIQSIGPWLEPKAAFQDSNAS